MEKLVALIIMSFLILIGIYFFNKGKLSAPTFTTLILGLIFLFIGFYSIDRLREFNVTGMRLVLDEMKDTKSNFDKRVDVMLEILADLNIDYTTSQGLWIDAPIPEKLVKARNASEQMLALAGKSKEEIAKQTNRIDSVILEGYLGQIYRNIIDNSAIFKQENSKNIDDIQTQFGKKLHEYNKGQALEIENLVKFLKQKGIEQELYQDYVTDMELYLKNHTLKKPIRPQ